jgi:hypothetical protein
MNKINEPLSSSKVRSALGDTCRILKYSELADYEHIKDLLPKVNDFVILLLEDSENHGHWTALMNSKNGYYYFNSYGKKYDSDLSVIPMCINRILGQDKREITRLLDGKSCNWNKKCFQGPKSQTCGRWCVIAITLICMMGYSPTEAEQYIIDKSELLGKGYDEFVAKFVSI